MRNVNGQLARESMLFQPFECNVPYVLRYMIDRDITGASWLSLPKGTYHLRQYESDKGTHCQVCDLIMKGYCIRVIRSVTLTCFWLVQFRLKPMFASTRSFLANPKVNGQRWHPCAFSHSTLNAKGERDTFPRQSMIQ